MPTPVEVLAYAVAIDGWARELAGTMTSADNLAPEWFQRWRRRYEALPARVAAAGPWGARPIWIELEGWHRAIVRAEKTRARGTSIGADAPPHEDDWWISTDDALDYAEWLNQRVISFERTLEEWSTRDAAAAGAWRRQREWDRWINDWRAYLDSLRVSFIARVNSWEHLKARHFELIGLATWAEEAGMNKVDVGEPPREPLATLSSAAGKAAGTLADILRPLAFIVGGVALLVLIRR